jgi:hypothetical protein
LADFTEDVRIRAKADEMLAAAKGMKQPPPGKANCICHFERSGAGSLAGFF